MAKLSKKKKIQKLQTEIARKLIDFCSEEKIDNPEMQFDVMLIGIEPAYYRLVFKRLDKEK